MRLEKEENGSISKLCIKSVNNANKSQALTKTYKILVRTLTGNILTFNNVEAYEFEEGFLKFKDTKTKETKRFPVTNCEIEEQKNMGEEKR